VGAHQYRRAAHLEHCRTQTQLASNYNKTITPGNAAGLTGYWPMDNTNGNVIKDATCSGQDIAFNTTNFTFISSTPTVPEVNYVEFANRFIVPNHALPTNYVYNSLNQAIQQTTPDGGTSNFWYDRLGRLSVKQNAEQKTPANGTDPANRYSYMLYDPLNRVVGIRGEAEYPCRLACHERGSGAYPRHARFDEYTGWLADPGE